MCVKRRKMESFATIEQAIEDIRRGKFVVVLDNEDRENEGDLIMAAELATEERVAFMVRHTTGIVCVPTTEKRLKELEFPQMVQQNREAHRCAFTVSVDFNKGTTTGVSASDRTKTIRAIADPKTKPTDFNRPGHIFPLKYTEGGVLARAGHTEASVDLAKLAGLRPAAFICELNDDQGRMLRRTDCAAFAKTHNLSMITIVDLIAYRCREEAAVKLVCEKHVRSLRSEKKTPSAHEDEATLQGKKKNGFITHDNGHGPVENGYGDHQEDCVICEKFSRKGGAAGDTSPCADALAGTEIHSPMGKWLKFSFLSLVDGAVHSLLLPASLSQMEMDMAGGNAAPISLFMAEDGGPEGATELQWAQNGILKRGAGAVVFMEGRKKLEQLSGARMAQLTQCGLATQMLKNVGIKGPLQVLHKDEDTGRKMSEALQKMGMSVTTHANVRCESFA